MDNRTVLEPIGVSVADAAKLAGVSRAMLYPHVMSGEIPSYTLGSRRLVLVSGLRAWAEGQVIHGGAA